MTDGAFAAPIGYVDDLPAAKAIVTGKGNFTGKRTVSFTIK